MQHSYTRSSGGGAPTEIQHPDSHPHAFTREQPLTLPPISGYAPSNYQPQKHNPYDARFSDGGTAPITLPSIHPHPHPPQHRHQQHPHHQSSWNPPRDSFHPHPYPHPSDCPPPQHLQQSQLQSHSQSQAQKYAILPSSPYVPSRLPSAGEARSLKKIGLRREREADRDRGVLSSDANGDKVHPGNGLQQQHHEQLKQQQQHQRSGYMNAPPQQVIAQQSQHSSQQHLSPREAEAHGRGRWVADQAQAQSQGAQGAQQQHQDLTEMDIRKRSASGESGSGLGTGKMLELSLPGMGGFVQQPSSSSSTGTSTPSTPGPRIPAADPFTYHLTMRQQPLSARACGFGERDRRVIDPPPILELKITYPSTADSPIPTGHQTPTTTATTALPTPAAAAVMCAERLRNPYFVVHCQLWSAEGDRDEGCMEDPRTAPSHPSGADSNGKGQSTGTGTGTFIPTGQRRLMGTLVSTPFVGQDEHGILGCFFCFPDLSCRTTGRYRLKFSMFLLEPEAMGRGDRRPVRAGVVSGVVVVWAAKDFPGMRASSRLTRRLKEQGCLISVKKGVERVGGKVRAVKGEEGSEGEEEEGGKGKGKGARRP